MVEEITGDILKKAYQFTTINFEYADVVKVLREGPNPRGNQRTIFKTKSDKSLDIYGLILKAIADNPPIIGISIDELKNRIDNLILEIEKKPDKQGIRSSLNKLQDILNEKENIYKVLEWKDNIIHILDPLFLFYLRWGTH